MFPFFDNIEFTVATAPGLGSFTPNAAVAGARNLDQIPPNVIVSYRAEEGSAWEIGYGRYDGSTLARVSYMGTSTGDWIDFGAGVKVALTIPADNIQPHLGMGKFGMWSAVPGTSAGSTFGLAVPTALGSTASGTMGSGNFMARQHRVTFTSATTTNATAGMNFANTLVYRSATAFAGGFDFSTRFGPINVVADGRVQVGFAPSALGSLNPSATLNMCAVGKDSTDTNLQIMYNDGSGLATKVDTFIPWANNNLYEVRIWQNPGHAMISFSVRLVNTGQMYLHSAFTDLPVVDVGLVPQIIAGLANTTGVAVVLAVSTVYLKSSF